MNNEIERLFGYAGPACQSSLDKKLSSIESQYQDVESNPALAAKKQSEIEFFSNGLLKFRTTAKEVLTMIRRLKDREKCQQLEAAFRKRFQQFILKNWAGSEGLIEGADFFFLDLTDPKVQKTISHWPGYKEVGDFVPHELGNLYLGYTREHFEKFKSYFAEIDESAESGGYGKDTACLRDEWSSPGIKRNYSWGGRYMVVGGGTIPIDSMMIDDFENLTTSTNHAEFRRFFKDRAGFELPNADEMSGIVKELAESLDWYRELLGNAIEAQKQSKQPNEKLGRKMREFGIERGEWNYDSYIKNLIYLIRILEDAKQGIEITELSETIVGLLPEKARHYNDLTYNADDWLDLDKATELINTELGIDMTLPTITQRIDRIFESRNGFDRSRFELLCREFSEYLSKKQKGKEIIE
jgi:hypothetical protein